MSYALLPALRLPDKPTDGLAFTRRPQWTQPLESLWGILMKWQFINCLPYSTMAACMFSRPYGGGYLGVDLRVLSVVDLGALSHHSGVPRAALAGGACVSSTESLVLAFTSTHLRYCPSCMHDGFHATLFQFTPIVRCPIHRGRLHEVCSHCRHRIAYRLDAASAARPFACPRCSHALLADPTVLMRPLQSADRFDNILKWQRFLAKYAYWYASGLRQQRDEAGRFVLRSDNVNQNKQVTKQLAFIGALQQRVHQPPPLPNFAARRVVEERPQLKAAATSHVAPSFCRQHWPHFYSRRFLALYRCYARFRYHVQQSKDTARYQVTLWWRRSWEGAIARACTPESFHEEPPFGIAEWFAFAPHTAPCRVSNVNHIPLSVRFEQDLQLTWDAWARVLDHLGSDSHHGLDPRLMPPRACWMADPAFEPESPALGVP